MSVLRSSSAAEKGEGLDCGGGFVGFILIEKHLSHAGFKQGELRAAGAQEVLRECFPSPGAVSGH